MVPKSCIGRKTKKKKKKNISTGWLRLLASMDLGRK
jgi:hypothetical protein